MRRFPLAFLLLGILSLLAAGAAILGIFQAPTSTDLAVHNGAGQTLAADRVVGTYQASNLPAGEIVYFTFIAPDTAHEVAKTTKGKVKAHRTVRGSTATGILAPLRSLSTFHHFSQRGSVYVSTENVKTLVPPAQRSSVTGYYRARVELASGYVVSIHIRLDAHERGQHVVAKLDYRLTQVGSWRRS